MTPETLQKYVCGPSRRAVQQRSAAAWSATLALQLSPVHSASPTRLEHALKRGIEGVSCFADCTGVHASGPPAGSSTADDASAASASARGAAGAASADGSAVDTYWACVHSVAASLQERLVTLLQKEPSNVSEPCLASMAQAAVPYALRESALVTPGSLLATPEEYHQAVEQAARGPAQAVLAAITAELASNRVSVSEVVSMRLSPCWHGNALRAGRMEGVQCVRRGRQVKLRCVMGLFVSRVAAKLSSHVQAALGGCTLTVSVHSVRNAQEPEGDCSYKVFFEGAMVEREARTTLEVTHAYVLKQHLPIMEVQDQPEDGYVDWQDAVDVEVGLGQSNCVSFGELPHNVDTTSERPGYSFLCFDVGIKQ